MWARAPAPIGDPLDEVALVLEGVTYRFDVTDGIDPWKPLSVVIVSPASDGGGYQSKEHPTPYEHPMLQVVYDSTPRTVFTDGFESGDVAAWTESTSGP